MVYADGSYSVMDMAGQKMLMVQPAMKTATLTHLGSKPENLPTMGDSIIAWLKTAETTGKAVGEKTIDGVRTLGFEAAFGATTMTLWGDPKTKLPVQIEATIGSPSEPIQMVMREFVFDAPLEDALFSTDSPGRISTQRDEATRGRLRSLGEVAAGRACRADSEVLRQAPRRSFSRTD